MLMEHAPVSFSGWKQELWQDLVAPAHALPGSGPWLRRRARRGFSWPTEATYRAGGLRNPLDVAPATW